MNRKLGFLFLVGLTLVFMTCSDPDTGTSTGIPVIEPGGNVTNLLTGKVSITGDLTEGKTLSADTSDLIGTGTISYQWKRKDAQSNEYTDISDAASSTYTLVTDDVDKFIKVTVTRDGYDGSVDSDTVGLVLPLHNNKTTVTGVTLDPPTASVLIGGTQAFIPTVTGGNEPAQTVTWTVTGGGAGTGITDGVLTVAANEPAASLIVRATSTIDISKSGTATVTVLRPTVTSVTVSPQAVDVNKGGTQKFTAVIAKENDPMQTITDAVTWSVTGGVSGTSIADDGTLTVAFGQTANLTVKAVSKFDSGKSGTATVTVTTPPLTGSVTIEGVVQEEQTLSANIVNLVGNGNGAITYRWERGNSSTGSFTNISDATSSTYKLVTADVGKYIKLTVNRSGYDGSITSDAVGPVKAKDVPTPTVTSVTVSPATPTVLIGGTQQFTATVNGTNNPAQTVTWTVTGGTGNRTAMATDGTLTVSPSETSATLTVRATSTIDTSKSGTATVTIPSLTGSVSISGTTQVGQILTANTGSLDGSGDITYKWARGDSSSGSFTDISGETSTYTLVTADRGKYIRVTVTRAGYRDSVTSAAVGAITLPALSGSVNINNNTVVGQSLTVNTGSLDGSGTITYQWIRVGSSTETTGTNIGTGASYTLAEADAGKYIRVTVSRNDRDGNVTSNAVGPITLPALSGTVTITGTLNVDSTLTASTNNLGGSGTISYQWASSSTSNGTFANISGATSSTYKLVTADLNKHIRVTVKRAGHSGEVTSAAVGPVTQPALSGSVSITGTTQVGQTLTANTSSLGGSGTISYQWSSSSTSNGTFANISGATSSTYTLVAADKDKYIKVTVTRTGYSGSVTSAATAQITQSASEVVKSTNTGSTAFNGLTSSASSYQVVDLPTDNNRQDVIKVSPADLGSGYAVVIYSLSAYKDKEITITLSADVKRVGAAGTLNWQVNNDPGYPSVASVSNAAAGTWHSMSGTWTGTPTNANPALYLSTYENSSSTTTYYIDNFTIKITETSTGGGGTGGGGAPTITTTPLDKNASGVQTFTSNSGGNKALSGSPYGYEMWTEGGNNNKLIWFGPNQGGGAAFRAEWNNPNDFLGRVGYFWNQGKPYTDYKNIYCDYNYTRSGRSTAGNYSYIGIYGWSRNPNASKEEEKLIEYYIVEDWFGNSSQSDTSPMGTGTTGGSEVGSYTLDGATYKVIKNVRVNKPSIDGDKTFTQFFSIRQSLRKTGTISITEHFKKWDGLNMKLGSNMYECKFLVEAGGGTGWLEFTFLKFSQEDSPR